MENRTIQILEALINEFIESGEPISSKHLYKIHDFGIKEATIRNELNSLMAEGFLEQPYVSSGRIPTDKGYWFFVERVLDNLIQDEPISKKSVIALKKELSKKRFEDFINDISYELGNLGVGYSKTENHTYKSGLDELFGNLLSSYRFNNSHETFQIIKDFEMINERINDLLNYFGRCEEPKVFIGKSPITKSRQLSVLADIYEIDGDKFVLAVIGPKQMDYSRNIRLLKDLKKAFNYN